MIEHDGSLSRKDAQSGDNHSFAPEIWEAVAAHFEGEIISIETAAKARKDRLATAPKQNPDFDLTDDGKRFSLIETGLYLRVFGDGIEGNARTEWVKTLFRRWFSLLLSEDCVGFWECWVPWEVSNANSMTAEDERLPFEEGFKRSDKALTISDILALVKKVEAVS